MGIGWRFFLTFINFVGTNPLRKYAYSHIGQPAILERKQLLGHNLTCTCALSLNGLEMIHFIYGGG